ncbi:MAG: M23 family metallopeptidase [Vampirovibrionales bacterium]|nr:M23 family metallopeptidase [Vampirovibrionales bacterium]
MTGIGGFASSVQAKSPEFAPVSGQVTSSFGWRNDPLGGGNRFHSGLDIAAPQGSPVYAPQNGYVVFSGPYKGYGNVVVLDHGYGLYTLYGHASTLYVSKGQAVRYGQTIAAVGSTGRSTGPHLHFEVHQAGQYVNPVNYLAWLSDQIKQSIARNHNGKSNGQMLAAFKQGPIQVTVQQESGRAMGGPLPPEGSFAASPIGSSSSGVHIELIDTGKETSKKK